MPSTPRLLSSVRRSVADRLVGVAEVRRSLPSDGEVALTFDDGPDPVWTPRLLDVLAEQDAVATFFCVGERVARHPEIVVRALAEGHRIGSHSATHPEPWTMGPAALFRDYRRGRVELEKVIGREERLFRPPNGHLSGFGGLAMRTAGLRPWLWTKDPRDWRPGLSRADVLEPLTVFDSGDVVLLHDALAGPHGAPVSERRATVDAVPELISRIRALGLECGVLP